MVRLKNIERDSMHISAYYEPEELGITGYISINIFTGRVIECIEPRCEEKYLSHKAHAIWTLQELSREKVLPKEKLIMWY